MLVPDLSRVLQLYSVYSMFDLPTVVGHYNWSAIWNYSCSRLC